MPPRRGTPQRVRSSSPVFGIAAGLVMALGAAAPAIPAQPAGRSAQVPRHGRGPAQTPTLAFPAPQQQPALAVAAGSSARPAVKGPAKPAKTPKASTTAPARAVFESRITAGNSRVRDRAGRTWAPRPVEFGSWRTSRSLVGTNIRGTGDDVLYQTVGFDVKWYRLAVPAAANYRVRLLMAETYWSKPGQRVFDVRAEGRTVVKNLDLVRVAGKGHAHDVRFTVPVRDGELSMTFPAKADFSLVSAIEVVSTTRVKVVRPKPVRRAVRFAPSSFWTQDVRRAPLAANSGRVVSNLAKQVADHYGGVAAFNAYEYNTAFHVASPGTRRINVGFFDCQRKRNLPWGLYDGDRHFVSVPVPPGAQPAAGTDAMMSIYDPAADQLWEFWQMRRSAAGGWRACWGGRLDRVSTKQGYFPGHFGTAASGVVLAGGMITIDEVKAGAIGHAIALSVIESQAWPQVSWPAQRTDGNARNPDVVMHGQRLRLDPSVDLRRYDLTPIGRIVAEAAQRYGFIVVDRSGAVSVATESGTAAGRTGTNPWDRLLGGPAYLAMKNFPWDRLQALPPDFGKDLPRVER